MTQLLRLRDAYAPYPHFYLTTSETFSGDSAAGVRSYVVGEANRQQPLRLLRVLFNVVRVVLEERPSVVLSTGAAPGCLACLVARCIGARIVWVDSIANVERLSLSGRIVRPFADLVLTQWPEVAERHADVEFVGDLV